MENNSSSRKFWFILPPFLLALVMFAIAILMGGSRQDFLAMGFATFWLNVTGMVICIIWLLILSLSKSQFNGDLARRVIWLVGSCLLATIISLGMCGMGM